MPEPGHVIVSFNCRAVGAIRRGGGGPPFARPDLWHTDDEARVLRDQAETEQRSKPDVARETVREYLGPPCPQVPRPRIVALSEFAATHSALAGEPLHQESSRLNSWMPPRQARVSRCWAPVGGVLRGWLVALQ